MTNYSQKLHFCKTAFPPSASLLSHFVLTLSEKPINSKRFHWGCCGVRGPLPHWWASYVMSIFQPLSVCWWWIVHNKHRLLNFTLVWLWLPYKIHVFVCWTAHNTQTEFVWFKLHLLNLCFKIWAITIFGWLTWKIAWEKNPVWWCMIFSTFWFQFGFIMSSKRGPQRKIIMLSAYKYFAFFLQQQWPPVLTFCHHIHTRIFGCFFFLWCETDRGAK